MDNEHDTLRNVHIVPKSNGGLCGIPYPVLRQHAIDVQVKLNPQDEEISNISENDVASRNWNSAVKRNAESLQDANNNTGLLWVEKFRPKNFLELLSDDGTNRTLLRWLKLWDKLVFNREVKSKKPNEADEKKNIADFNAKPSPTEVILELDEVNRPKQKCALLYGPPGLGKTTLAHIIAATAGYNAVEMNASDDRSLEKFQEKLEAATQMKSVLNQKGDERPNCLIVDEIDGSTVPVINFLINAITGAGTNKTKKKKKGKKEIMLQRPIICICNDLYVPALRPLRQHALHVPFPPTLSSRLTQRLQDIASREKMRTDMTALMALAEKTDNDIRSCLSTLQFFKSRGKYMRAVDVHKTNIGQKDVHRSLFSIWEDIFQIPRSSSKRKFVGSNQSNGNEEFVQEENLSSMPIRFKTILNSVQGCGDYEKMIQGAFENYLMIKFKDVKMQNALCGNDWLQFFDVMQQQILHSQNYSTMGYMPYTFVAFHLLFGASGPKPKISWPNEQFEMKNKLRKSNNIIETMIADMSPGARIFASPTTLVCDVLPCLLRIIQTNLRPVNTQLYSPREKQELKQLVEILIAYNVTYVQEMTPEGQYAYRLDPELEEATYFPNISHYSVPYAIKQLVAHEVEVEKMRRKEPSYDQEAPTNQRVSKADKENMRQIKDNLKLTSNAVPNHLQKLKAKNIEVADRVPVDFFGRRIEKVAKTTAAVTDGKESNKKEELVFSDVWFNFKEGFNNAVRRTIRMKDLM